MGAHGSYNTHHNGDDGLRTILHADLDCFFAAVEIRDDPSLKGKPVAVGGSATGRGVVSAASYEAREYGVRSAMSMARALRLCPHLHVCHGSFERYKEASRQVFAIFERFTPLVQPISIDEAFLDVTGSEPLFGDGPTIARAIRKAVLEEVGLVVSIGVATNKFVAKLASPMDKPDGLTIAPRDPAALREWLAPIPVGRMWGIGKATEPKLLARGYRIFRDLQEADRERLRSDLGEHALKWQERARGEDVRDVNPVRSQAKTVGHETTFAKDIADRASLRVIISRLADQVAARARSNGYEGTRITVKLRYADFTTITRQTSVRKPVQEADPIFDAAWTLLTKAVPDGTPLRLVGVTLGNITERSAPRQRSLFDPPEPVEPPPPPPPGRPSTQERTANTVDRTLDEIRQKLGKNAIQRGRDLAPSRDSAAARHRTGPSDGPLTKNLER